MLEASKSQYLGSNKFNATCYRKLTRLQRKEILLNFTRKKEGTKALIIALMYDIITILK